MIRITNTLKGGEKNLPKPKEGPLRMFVCGPTVYDYIHIGNARTFVVFDVIAKYLRYRGYKLKYIQNITDIDDRIIRRAKEIGVDPKELARKFEKTFLDNMRDLKVDSVNKYPRATDYIKQIIKQVKTLIEKGNAYLVEGDGYYFDLTTFPEYGKLSRRTIQMAEDAVSRIDESAGKRNRGDFCLWKFSRLGEPSWPADIGAGRPGWHIEDTAITEKYFGPQYEIHGGGQDLMFPHHEAEIAQQESASGLKPFVKYWLHAGFIVQKGEKMSKSRSVFLTVRDALKKYPPQALRFYFLSAHYRSPLDYTEENLKQAEAAVARLGEFLQKIQSTKNISLAADFKGKVEQLGVEHQINAAKQAVGTAMDDDFNAPAALGWIFNLTKNINPLFTTGKVDSGSANKLADFMQEMNKIFGIVLEKAVLLPRNVQTLIDLREAARATKSFKGADELREQIKNLGYEVEDTVYGPLVKKRKETVFSGTILPPD